MYLSPKLGKITCDINFKKRENKKKSKRVIKINPFKKWIRTVQSPTSI
jgi:hypothetical protein